MIIRVAPYNPHWAAEFDAESKRINDALGKVILSLHHIGSTAIPGMSAKPIIDMLLEVVALPALDAQRSKLEGLGYEAMGEFGIPGRRYFRRNNPHGVRTHQVHAFAADNPDIRRHLAFRDFMIARPEIARRYEELKRQLARQHPDNIDAYMAGKDAFVKRYEAEALLWR